MLGDLREERIVAIHPGSARVSGTTSNNALERTGEHRGRAALAMDCVLAGTERASWLAAQLGR